MPWLNLRRWWLVSAVLGILAGILWWAITDTATWTVTKGGTSINNDETRLQFGAVVSFVLIGAGICALLGFAIAFFSEVSWPAVPAVAGPSGGSSPAARKPAIASTVG